MKMRIFMRILLTVYILGVLFVAGVMLLCAWGIIDVVHPGYWVSSLYNNSAVRIIASVISIAVVMLSIALMFSGIRKRKPKSALIKVTGTGAISISLSAMEEMATRYIEENTAIRSVKSYVAIKDSKVDISAKLAVTEGSNIPEVLLSLQTGLKEHIEILTGVQVNKILLLVEKTSQVVKARVE